MCQNVSVNTWVRGPSKGVLVLFSIASYETSWFLQVEKPSPGRCWHDSTTQHECQLQSRLYFCFTFSGYACCCQLSWPNDSSLQTFPCMWRGWIYPLQLWWLYCFCLMCSGSFKESYLVSVFLFSTCTLGFCFHKFLLLIILFSILLREITGKLFFTCHFFI